MSSPAADHERGLAPGDLRLLRHEVTARLLASKELARLAYVAPDCTPRVIPMLFHWTGTDLILSTFGGPKVRAITERPDVAVTIDAASTPPSALFIRGRASVGRVEGIVPEYALAQQRYAGPEQAAATLAEIDQPGLSMTGIAVRPTWVEVLDFQTRFPGGGSSDEFDQRGR